MHTLELPALRDILAGSVGVFNAYNLCHIRSINWDEIITGTSFFIISVIDDHNFIQISPFVNRSQREIHLHIQLHITRT